MCSPKVRDAGRTEAKGVDYRYTKNMAHREFGHMHVLEASREKWESLRCVVGHEHKMIICSENGTCQ